MRTIRVEMEIPIPGTRVGGRFNGQHGMVRVSTEVIAEDDIAAAREAGEQANEAMSAFLDGYNAQ